MAQVRVPVFFALSRYLTDKYFDVLWGYGLPWEFPQIQLFERLHLRCQCFLISAVDILGTNILT